jgi:hypothetical protein
MKVRKLRSRFAAPLAAVAAVALLAVAADAGAHAPTRVPSRRPTR